MGKKYGYCRISKPTQNIQRQIRNISSAHPDAHIIEETYTGTRFQGREKFERLIKMVRPGDTIVFDSVSRMSRSADEGFQLYKQLFERGIELIYLKEPQINTSTYKAAMERQVSISVNSGDSATDEFIQSITDAIGRYILRLADRQIHLAFQQAEKEVQDLHQRTKEGIETARLAGKQIGLPAGRKLHVKKSAAAKEQILKYSRAFDGALTDTEVIKLVGIASNTYYKYKKELYEIRAEN